MLITEGIRSVREQITERLRAEILSGRMSEGQRLQEAKLCLLYTSDAADE